MNRVVILGGKTGGPIIPALAIAKNIVNSKIIVFGINKGFEQSLALEQKLKFIAFPLAKLSLLTYKKNTISEIIINIFDLFWSVIKLISAFVWAIWHILSIRPALIISTGSFLAVPVLYALAFLKFLKLSKTMVLIHQQDPEPGLSNKLTVRFGNSISCVFESTKKYSGFQKALIIPNPFDFQTIQKPFLDNVAKQLEDTNPKIISFLNKKDKPLLLIFGGGSGSEFLNSWTLDSRDKLEKKFNILHITGTFRQKNDTVDESYFSIDKLLEPMKLALYRSDLVISRCGMGSITELQNLAKPAFLVPMPHSHQEQNAAEVENMFYILHQIDSTHWLDTIDQQYPKWFLDHQKNILSAQTNEQKLKSYYQKIAQVLK